MGNPKCTLPKEERAEIFRMFRGSLTADEEDTLRGMFPQYLFFQNAWDDTGLDLEPDRNTRRCFCTSCREGFDAVRGNYARGRLHGEPCDCPVCGARLEGRAVMKYRYDMPSLQSWIKAAVCYAAPDGGLLVEAGDCRRSFNHDELAGVIEWYPKARYYFHSGKAMMWKEVIMSWACGPEVAEFKAAFDRAQAELVSMLKALRKVQDEALKAKLTGAVRTMFSNFGGQVEG